MANITGETIQQISDNQGNPGYPQSADLTIISRVVDDVPTNYAMSMGQILNYNQGSTGAVNQTISQHLKLELYIEDFGGVADGVTPNDTALINAINAYKTIPAPGYAVGYEIKFKKGIYYFANTITLNATVRLKGMGQGIPRGDVTVFKFPINVTGIIPTQTGAGSYIGGIAVSSTGGTSATAHGVDMRYQMVLEDFIAGGFPGNNVNIVADVGSGTNANGWQINRAYLLNAGVNNMYVQGGDANAGMAIGINCGASNGWGIYDNSFLGNTYIGCEVANSGTKSIVSYGGQNYYCLNSSLAASTTPGTNSAVWEIMPSTGAGYPAWSSSGVYLVGGAYAGVNANSRNGFINCYSEGGQPPSKFVSPTMVWGGLHAAYYYGSGSVALGYYNSLQTFTNNVGANVALGSSSTSPTMLTLKSPYAGQVYNLNYATGSWALNYAGLGAGNVINFYDGNATIANGYTRNFLANSPAALGFPLGYFIGYSIQNYVSSSSAAPVSGSWAQGDIIYNNAPSAGGFIGWVCTTAGTPGTWKTFGAISV